MDLDHDMDIDVDLVADEPIVPELDAVCICLPRLAACHADCCLPQGNRSPGEIDDDADTRCPSKVYIKGLDVMNPNDVKAYVAEHCSENSLDLERIEWIDDNSANLLFASEAIASQALVALAANLISDVSQLSTHHLLPAKPFLTRPEITLQVRPARESDKKWWVPLHAVGSIY